MLGLVLSNIISDLKEEIECTLNKFTDVKVGGMAGSPGAVLPFSETWRGWGDGQKKNG